jgi:hypothetical protein
MTLVAVAEDLTGTTVTGNNHEAAIVLDIKEVEMFVGSLIHAAAKAARLDGTDDALPLKEMLGFLESLLFTDGLGTEAERKQHKNQYTNFSHIG